MTGIDRRGFVGAGLGATAGTLAARGRAAEASLVLYNGQHRETTEALVAAFTKASGIRVVTRNAESPELAAQIAEEGAHSPADVFFSEQSPPICAVQDKGLLGRVAPATLAAVPSRWVAHDGSWIGVTLRTRVITYNKAMVTPTAMPKSILDFATPALDGRFGYVKQDGFQEQIMAIVRLRSRETALEWLKGLKRYGRSYNGNRVASNAVENGEIAMALSNDYYWYSLAKEVGSASLHSALYSFPAGDPGNIVNASAAGMLRSSRNQAAAQALLAFMVSRPGQQAMVDTTAEYPVVAGVTSPFNLPSLDAFSAPVDPADMGSAAQAYALEREAGLI